MPSLGLSRGIASGNDTHNGLVVVMSTRAITLATRSEASKGLVFRKCGLLDNRAGEFYQ